MRRLINLFKEPLYKDDFKRALLYGSLHMLLFGILAGALQFFALGFLNLMFSLLIYLVAYMIGKGISDKIFNYHILYSIISVVFFLIGYIIYYISFYSFVTHNVAFSISYVLSWDGLRYLVFGFLNFKSYVGIDILYNILDMLIFIFCILTAWRMPEQKK